jgi:hypothetical protein
MSDKVGCTAFPGRERFTGGGHCHDCWTPDGGMHHPGCDDERCDHGSQAIGDCPECDDDDEDYWTRIGTTTTTEG